MSDLTNSELTRIRNNMRIGATALKKDIEAYEASYGYWTLSDHPEVLRLKWWCEQLLKELRKPVAVREDSEGGLHSLPLFVDGCVFDQVSRNSYVKR